MTEGVAKSKYPVAIFELISGGRSGFVREDTVRDKVPDEIKFPKVRAINRCSAISEWSDQYNANVQVKTRWVYGHPEIIETKLVEQKINFTLEKPTFINGLLTVPKDGATVGLYNFLTTHGQNIDNPKRIKHLKALFREIKPEENAKQFNATEFDRAEAIMYVRNLIKSNGGEYEYAEDRIDALCTVLNVAADGYSAKIEGLIKLAKYNPLFFLEEAKKSEQVALINVNHGIKLKVITFEGNTAMYAKKNLKIKTFQGNLSTDEKKIATLANWFQTADGKQQYEVYLEELKAAKADEIKS